MRIRTIGLIVTLALGMFAGALPTDAQEPGKVYRIGFLGSNGNRNTVAKAFLERFRELGWIEGKHFVMVYQTTPRNQVRLQCPAHAAELVQRKVDLIVTSFTQCAVAANAATSTIPIVMSSSTQPVELGLIESFARPGGNVTGMTNTPPFADEFFGKQLQVFNEAVPGVKHMALVLQPLHLKTESDKNVKEWEKQIETIAKQVGLTVFFVKVEGRSIDADALASITQQRADSIWIDTSIAPASVERIMEFANTHRLPVFTNSKRVLRAGALMSYYTNRPARWRRTAYFVDRILKGAKPADLPVESPTKFDFVINLKAVEQFGITIPPEVLYQATEVIR